MANREKFDPKKLKVKLAKNKLKLKPIVESSNIRPVLTSLTKEAIKIVLDLVHNIFLGKKISLPFKLKNESSSISDSVRILSKKFVPGAKYIELLSWPLKKIINLLCRHQIFIKKILSYVLG